MNTTGVAFLPMSFAYMITTYMLTCIDQKISRWFCCIIGTSSVGLGVLGLSFVESLVIFFHKNI